MFPAGTPQASRAEHMAGSQATIMSPLTWPATHAAACSRAGAAGLDVARRRAGGGPANRAPLAPAARNATTARR